MSAAGCPEAERRDVRDRLEVVAAPGDGGVTKLNVARRAEGAVDICQREAGSR